METNLYLKDECYKIVGHCMEVHTELGHGFSEVVYKDALEIIFRQEMIPFEREKIYRIMFRGEELKRKYVADFIVMLEIILEVKCASNLLTEHTEQCINYLKVSGNKLCILVNFALPSLQYKRIVF